MFGLYHLGLDECREGKKGDVRILKAALWMQTEANMRTSQVVHDANMRTC